MWLPVPNTTPYHNVFRGDFKRSFTIRNVPVCGSYLGLRWRLNRYVIGWWGRLRSAYLWDLSPTLSEQHRLSVHSLHTSGLATRTRPLARPQASFFYFTWDTIAGYYILFLLLPPITRATRGKQPPRNSSRSFNYYPLRQSLRED